MTTKKKAPRNIMGFEAEPELRKQIDRLAEEQDRSRSWVIRQLLLQALAANGKPA